ncbi:MAG: helix-turn-helix domain-containing protein [Terriglobia bacterium]|nr:helix-turn-helix domain-containing protein [Terriglobia bacterium]
MVSKEPASPINIRTYEPPFAQRLTCSVAEACEATGLGRTKIYALIAEGCLKSTTVGRRRLIQVTSLQRLVIPH